MKKVLLATSILAGTAGFAAAEVTLSGSARMGIISDFDNVALTSNEIAGETGFTSRARVVFTLSGETDGGLSFGATFRADNAGAANVGEAGSVFISGAFGKLSMGDVDGAAQMAVGQVSGVGLTGLGDLNEIVYLGAGDGLSDPTALYEYSTGAFTGYLSVTNPAAPGNDVFALGAKYSTDTFSVSIGYEDVSNTSLERIVLGASATFGAATVKAVYGMADGLFDEDQYALSVDYTADALTVTAFYAEDFLSNDRYGLGATYDLGGGASVVGGYSVIDTGATDDSSFDLGLSFSF